MLNPDTELIFPVRLLDGMKNIRGEGWKVLIEETTEKNVDMANKVAMTLVVARVSGCTTCSADSYRATRGCKLCSQQAIKRCKNSDAELENLYKRMLIKTRKFIEKHKEMSSY